MMTMPPEHMKERLSVSYVTAVAAKAGVACRFTTQPEYGTDAYLVKVRKVNKRYTDTGVIVSCQIKATSTSELNGDHIIFDMEAEDYNKLADWDGTSPCILVLLCLPQEPFEWLFVCEAELILKKCCYWFRVTDPPTTNRRSRRIMIPRSQLFTPEAVQEIMSKVERGEL